MTVYLIHFKTKYRHAQHYIGYANDVYQRIHKHRINQGARLMEVINNAGIDWVVARVWWGADRTFERELKNRKHSSRFCPICRQEAQLRLPWFSDPDLDYFSWDDIEPIPFNIGGVAL